MKGTICVVHNDGDYGTLLDRIFPRAGYVIMHLRDANVLLAALQERSCDLCILDAEVPNVNAFALCRQLRDCFPDLGILFLSARAALAERLRGFACGADDYLARPFHPAELVAHVEAILRRCQRAAHNRVRTQVRVGTALLDLGALRFCGPTGKAVVVTPTEMKVLGYLMSHADAAVSREQVAEWVWGWSDFSGSNRTDAYVKRVRKKIEADPRHPALIETVRGMGYRFRTPGQHA